MALILKAVHKVGIRVDPLGVVLGTANDSFILWIAALACRRQCNLLPGNGRVNASQVQRSSVEKLSGGGNERSGVPSGTERVDGCTPTGDCVH